MLRDLWFYTSFPFKSSFLVLVNEANLRISIYEVSGFLTSLTGIYSKFALILNQDSHVEIL